MDYLPPIDELEADTQQLLTVIADRKQEIQHGTHLQRLQGLLQKLEADSQELTWTLPPDDPLWQQIYQQKEDLQNQIENLLLDAPLSALESFSAVPVTAPANLVTHRYPRSSVQWTICVMVIVSLTLMSGCIRLSQSHFELTRPFISQPTREQ